MYYTVIKHCSYWRTLEKYRKNYIVFSNPWLVMFYDMGLAPLFVKVDLWHQCMSWHCTQDLYIEYKYRLHRYIIYTYNILFVQFAVKKKRFSLKLELINSPLNPTFLPPLQLGDGRRGWEKGMGKGDGKRGREKGMGEGDGKRGWEKGMGEGDGRRGWEKGMVGGSPTTLLPPLQQRRGWWVWQTLQHLLHSEYSFWWHQRNSWWM